MFNILTVTFIFTIDGGPDENPRYQKVIRVAIHHFLRYDFYSLFIATNAPGRSAFNRVERKKAPLSKELTGLILLHEHYSSHLNERGITIDAYLEKKNFKFAGVTLAEIWSQIIVDKFRQSLNTSSQQNSSSWKIAISDYQKFQIK